jgi:hypothetical protein
MAKRTVCVEMHEIVIAEFEHELPDAPRVARKIRSDGYLVIPAGASSRTTTFQADTVVMAERVRWVS